MRCGPIARLSFPVSQHLLLDCFRRLWGHVIVAASAAPFLGPQLLRFCPDGLFHLFLGVGFVPRAITPNCCLGLGNALSGALCQPHALTVTATRNAMPFSSREVLLLPAPLHILLFSSVYTFGVWSEETYSSISSSLLPSFPQRPSVFEMSFLWLTPVLI